MISVCIVTYNEEHNIRDCLESVKWATEISIVDSGSTDNTFDICKSYTDCVTISPWSGCGPQKQKAVTQATQPWILLLDADERVSPELAVEIQASIATTVHSAFAIRFHSYYCGHRIKFGDWLCEKHIRLFRRDKATIQPDLIHHGLSIQGDIVMLKHIIEHYSFRDFETVLNKQNQYSTAAALQKYRRGCSTTLMGALCRSSWTFVRGYFLKLGFLDGRIGLLLALSNTAGCFYKYIKLLRLCQQI